MSIPTVRFRIRKEKYTIPTLQAYIGIYGEEATKYSTQVKARPELRWNQKKQRFEASTELAHSYNQILTEIVTTVNNCFLHMTRTARTVTAKTLKKDFIKIWEKENKTITVMELMTDFLKFQDSRKLEIKSREKYTWGHEHLKTFLKKKHRCEDLEIHNITAQFGYQYFRFLTSKKEPLSEATANRYLQQLRACLNFAIENGKIEENPLNYSRPKVSHAKPNKATITEQQMLKIFRLDELTTTERHIADICTFLFYTTYDHCDYLEFSHEKHLHFVDAQLTIQKRRYKERNKAEPLVCVVSVNNILKKILDRNKPFPKYPSQTVLKIFKRLASRIGIDATEIGLKQLRKSGGTFYINEGVPLKTVSEKILGHTTVAMTEHYYIKIFAETALKQTSHLQER
ncbi:site-specific integrase [Emticicia sp. W12TSBA100-4]|uniref:tyrosine-type recombinase/integrase n=1 Tax=Emticicia sp. W12TSBA100-4 TaxID=3160965 RepID=UPI003305B0E0